MPQINNRSDSVQSVRAGKRSDTLIFPLSSEEPVRRFDGNEVLSHAEGDVDLTWLNSGNAPLLDTHDNYRGLRAQLGVVEAAWLDNKRLYVEVRFSKRPEAQAVKQDMIDGIVRNVSVGYSFEKASARKLNDEDDTYVVRSWTPTEASIVPVPADRTVGLGRSHVEISMSKEQMPDPEQIEAERAEKFENALNEVRALASTHNIGKIGESFIEAEVRKGSVPSIEAFRGIARSTIPEGTALRNEDIGLTPKETRRFSVMKLARAMADGAGRKEEEEAAFEIEASRAAADISGKATVGRYTVPADVMRAWGDFEVDGVHSRAAMATSANANVQDVDHLAGRFIDNLRNASSILRAGVTVLDGLDGNVDIPAGNANSTAAWLTAEDQDVAETVPSFRKVSLSVKDLGAYTDITRRMLQQSTIAIEMYVRNQLVEAMVQEIDRAGLYGTGTGVPTGVMLTNGINAVDFATASRPTRSEIIDMRTAIATTNRGRGITFLGNSAMVGYFQKTVVDAGTGVFLMGDSAERIVGNPFIESNQVLGTDLLAGYWPDAMMGMWGGLELDRSTEAKFLSGGLRLRAIQSVDFAVGRVGSFTLGRLVP